MIHKGVIVLIHPNRKVQLYPTSASHCLSNSFSCEMRRKPIFNFLIAHFKQRIHLICDTVSLNYESLLMNL